MNNARYARDAASRKEIWDKAVFRVSGKEKVGMAGMKDGETTFIGNMSREQRDLSQKNRLNPK